jgi:hypothetical protein
MVSENSWAPVCATCVVDEEVAAVIVDRRRLGRWPARKSSGFEACEGLLRTATGDESLNTVARRAVNENEIGPTMPIADPMGPDTWI